jgi:hypothetical protein
LLCDCMIRHPVSLPIGSLLHAACQTFSALSRRVFLFVNNVERSTVCQLPMWPQSRETRRTTADLLSIMVALQLESVGFAQVGWLPPCAFTDSSKVLINYRAAVLVCCVIPSRFFLRLPHYVREGAFLSAVLTSRRHCLAFLRAVALGTTYHMFTDSSSFKNRPPHAVTVFTRS